MKTRIKKDPICERYLPNVKPDKLLENRPKVKCPACGSYRFVKAGFHRSPKGKVQRYLCKECAYRFTFLSEVKFSG